MRKIEAAFRAFLRLWYLSAILAVLGVGVLGGFYESKSRQAAEQSARADVLDRLSLLRSQLQAVVDANVQMVQGLVAVISYEPGMSQEQFDRLAARLLRDTQGNLGISVAPDLVVRMIYPLTGNDQVLGLDYRTVPAQMRAAEMARNLGTTVLGGPVDLVQGGRAFIVRTPVFIEGDHGSRTFWGIVSTAINEAALYEAAGLSDPTLPLNVVLAGRDGFVADREVFYGDPKILAEHPVVTRVALPFGSWEMAAVPRGGWPGATGIWVPRSLFVLAGLLIVAPVIGAAQLVASRQGKLAVIRDREAELSRLSWRLEFALAASKIGVWDVDLATDELLWDERAKALFGFTGRTGVFGEADWSGALHPDDRERAMAEAQAAVTGNGKFVTEYRIVLPDGAVRHIRDMAALYQGEDDSKRLVGLVWDVTPDVERQEELNLRRLEAEAATLAKSRFLAAMSHEIRTPMSGVLGVLGLILDGPLSAKQRERGRIALSWAESLLQILNDILDFSKLEANQIRISEEHVAVRQLVGEVIELMAAGAEQNGLSLGYSVSSAVPERIVTDPMRLRQVLTNLLSNAIKFTEAGEIEVTVDYSPGERDGTLEIKVEDTGIGIPEDQCGQIFRDFVQADNSLTRRAGGTGLGLAICRQLVELMGGEIGVRSVPGMGSAFSFTVRVRPAGELEADTERSDPAEDLTVPKTPMRVLLAEDHATNQYLINAYLRREGHAVVIASNGAEVVAAASAGGFDVVLMDVQMPVLDGISATRAIREVPGPAGAVPIVALTANAMQGDRESCFAAGMNDYLSKPVDVVALREALERARIRGAKIGVGVDRARRSATGR